MRFYFSHYLLESRLNARRPWTFAKRFPTETGWFFVWGKLSVEFCDLSAEVFMVCAECNSGEIGSQGCGDESWLVCSSCRTVEGNVRYVNIVEYENS